VSDRRTLKFAGADDVAADVKRLRPGYRQAGSWNLPQISWHLDKAIRFSMEPRPPIAPSLVQKMQLKAILAIGRIPNGVQAPERVQPPPDTPESAIDEFLEALVILKDFKGEFAPHRMLGSMDHDQFMRLHLIHCAHHISFLSPTSRQE
jgi:hypothetical protein